MGDPAGRVPRRHLLEHLVDLLEREALHLGHQEEGEEEGQDAERAPDEEDLGAEVGGAGRVADHVRGDDADDAVPEPIGRRRDADAASTDRQGEALAHDDPGGRAPADGEGADVEADEGDHGAHGRGVVGILAARRHADDGDDVLHDHHQGGAVDEQGAASEALDGPEGDGCGAHVDEGGDQRDQERVADVAELLEEGCAKIEDEVDT